jgi:hypothetical protein
MKKMRFSGNLPSQDQSRRRVLKTGAGALGTAVLLPAGRAAGRAACRAHVLRFLYERQRKTA